MTVWAIHKHLFLHNKDMHGGQLSMERCALERQTTHDQSSSVAQAVAEAERSLAGSSENRGGTDFPLLACVQKSRSDSRR